MSLAFWNVDSALSSEHYRLPGDPYSQVIGGEVVSDKPTEAHRLFAGRIQEALGAWTGRVRVRGEALSSVHVVLDEDNVFTPDVAYFRRDRVPDEGVTLVDGPPTLAVEVRSLGTWRYCVGPKMRAYERAGLAELWLVDSPVASVLVYRRSEPASPEFDVARELIRGQALTSPLLPGFALALDDIFAPRSQRD